MRRGLDASPGDAHRPIGTPCGCDHGPGGRAIHGGPAARRAITAGSETGGGTRLDAERLSGAVARGRSVGIGRHRQASPLSGPR